MYGNKNNPTYPIRLIKIRAHNTQLAITQYSRLRYSKRNVSNVIVYFWGSMIDVTGNKAHKYCNLFTLIALIYFRSTKTGFGIVFYTDQQCRPRRSPIIGEKVPEEPISALKMVAYEEINYKRSITLLVDKYSATHLIS